MLWAKAGECQKKPGFMNIYCKASCGLCQAPYDLKKGETFFLLRQEQNAKIVTPIVLTGQVPVNVRRVCRGCSRTAVLPARSVVRLDGSSVRCPRKQVVHFHSQQSFKRSQRLPLQCLVETRATQRAASTNTTAVRCGRPWENVITTVTGKAGKIFSDLHDLQLPRVVRRLRADAVSVRM